MHSGLADKQETQEIIEMKDVSKYNRKLALRWNHFLRHFINKRNQKLLKNTTFSLLCNNCNGGIISHDLGLQFRSPTINLFFYGDHFFRFCENLDYYLAQELVVCENPQHKPEIEYPVCLLDDLELHFLHYSSFSEAKEKWDSRTRRINKDNLFIMWSFYDFTDIELLQRFDKLPFQNKVAFTEKEFPEYPSAFCVRNYEDGLGVLTLFDGLNGKRKIDQFNYVKWFNEGK